MGERIVKIADDFWNIRGEFKIGGLLNIGTHSSLVRCASGKYVLLDAYTLNNALKAEVDALTNNGADIDAIINLHPFHTVHVAGMHEQYPNARLYGTQRHHAKFPDLPWQAELTESEECAALFAQDFEFSVPAGVDFISSNEHLHFSSVLAYHKSSKTIHADDTLMYLPLPGLLGKLKKAEVSFHMTLAKTLEKRPGAAQDFRDWATQLSERWALADNLCAAHSATLLDDTIASRIRRALQKVEKTLRAHEEKYA
ncbi:hypothetical protein [Zhongshania sp.]|uniref:hypothetical protein n=1 Tax=Zhongshania sp. TaxID=1971902 RepID=UPI003566E683